MKKSFIITGLLVALTCGASAQEAPAPATADSAPDASASAEILSVGLTPKQKKAITVDSNELNPFAIVIDEAVEKETYEDISAQEQKIRGVFNQMNVCGVTQSGTGYKVLIGDMILREGQTVPSVIPDQTEQLEVLSITDEEMVLGWIEEREMPRNSRRKADKGRQLTIPISHGAAVTPRLPRSVGSGNSTRNRR
ncbi:hypothetical protein OAF27_00425 [Verrucomicrobiales bacterium]|nr:hypothetical protein [Verrucomicrobiales bacterium]